MIFKRVSSNPSLLWFCDVHTWAVYMSIKRKGQLPRTITSDLFQNSTLTEEGLCSVRTFSLAQLWKVSGLLRQSYPKPGEMNLSLRFLIASTGCIWLSWALREGHRKCIVSSHRIQTAMEGTENKKSNFLISLWAVLGSCDATNLQTYSSLKAREGTEAAQFGKSKWQFAYCQ